MKKIVPLSLLLLLAACATPEQIAERKERQEKEDFDTCVRYGLRPGSEAFGNCRLQLDLARQQHYNTYPYPSPRIGSSFYYVR